MLTQHRFGRLARKHRMVVLFAQMAKPYMSQLRRSRLCQQIRRLLIVQMPFVATDAVFEEGRILAHKEHIDIMVRLQDKIIGQPYLLANCICNMTNVSDKAEANTICLDNITHAIATVVRHIERRNAKVAYLYRLTLLHESHTVCRHLNLQATVASNALVRQRLQAMPS